MNNETLDAAYAKCRLIARREAKNFYYSFVALPEPRKNAICAIYAFMRQADDLADDESLSLEERRKRLDAWLTDWRGVCHGGDSSDLVFLAVRDAVERFNIPLNLLDELVAGVTMDLKPAASDAPDTYATFADLYRYCYLVASVVGLVCIRIFGYTDPRAEKLAEETGIAFQLTNILRDVAEDAERNRVYLPLEDLAAHECHTGLTATSQSPALRQQPMNAPCSKRSASVPRITISPRKRCMPLIDRESRPALWVLVSIYHGLAEAN